MWRTRRVVHVLRGQQAAHADEGAGEEEHRGEDVGRLAVDDGHGAGVGEGDEVDVGEGLPTREGSSTEDERQARLRPSPGLETQRGVRRWGRSRR